MPQKPGKLGGAQVVPSRQSEGTLHGPLRPLVPASIDPLVSPPVPLAAPAPVVPLAAPAPVVPLVAPAPAVPLVAPAPVVPPAAPLPPVPLPSRPPPAPGPPPVPRPPGPVGPSDSEPQAEPRAIAAARSKREIARIPDRAAIFGPAHFPCGLRICGAQVSGI
jgi:hypothetical protein